MTFEKKRYLVTGANSGIGKTLTQQLLRCGAIVFGVDINDDWIKEYERNYPGKLFYQTFDLSKLENIEQVFNNIVFNGDKLDGMVHCAGISPLITLKDYNKVICDKTFNINLFSFIAMSQFFMNEKYTNDKCSIVGVSSSTSVYGGNRQYLYSSSKAAMNVFVKSVAKELALRGTRVNTVLPSITDTEMVQKLRKESDAIDINVKYKQPFGIIDPIDVCKTILYLLSDDSCAISGTNLKINNGESY